MIRKVIKQANQAYTITLPIEWVRENNIDKNQEVDIDLQDKTLIVKNNRMVSTKKIKISIESADSLPFARRIDALYARGVDEIEVSSKVDISARILEVTSELIGYALVSQSKNNYVIKDIGGGNYSNLDEIFKRVFQMVLMFYDSAIEDLFGKETETRDSLDRRDREINKFCLFLERAINKMSYADPIKGRTLFTYSFALEKIGDEVHRLWRSNIENKSKKSQKLKELLLMSKEGLELSFDFYYSGNLEIADKIYNLKQKVRKNAEALSKQESSDFARHAIKIIEDAADLNHLNLIMTADDK